MRKKKVVIISVAGAFRKGKSFLLDYFLRYLSRRGQEKWIGESEPLSGFSWRSGVDRETTGIWIWDTPFLETLPNGEEVAIFLMDTQGTFDTESTVRDNATIFGLSTLISSVQIYNISQRIQEDDLQHLHLFTEYGQLAAHGEMGADPNCKAFQRLLCLVRDWTSVKEFKHGSEGGQEYLEKILKTTEKQHQELRSVREHIHSSFESLSCFLMPHPGLEMVESEDYKGAADVLRGNFREELSKLVEFTLKPERLVVKKVNGVDMTAKDVFKYLDIYLKMYQDPTALPEPKTALQATAEANNVSAKERSINHYNEEMRIGCSGRYLAKKKKFETLHVDKREESLKLFDNIKKLGGKEFSNKYRKELEEGIEKAVDKYKNLNEAKASIAGLKTPVCLVFLLLLTYILSHEYIDKMLSVVWLEVVATVLETFFWLILLSLMGYIMVKLGNIENDLLLSSLGTFDAFADLAWDNGLKQAGQIAVNKARSMGFTPSNVITAATTGQMPVAPSEDDDNN